MFMRPSLGANSKRVFAAGQIEVGPTCGVHEASRPLVGQEGGEFSYLVSLIVTDLLPSL